MTFKVSEVLKNNNFCASYLTIFLKKSIGINFGILLRLVNLMNLILIVSHLNDIQEREQYSCDFVQAFNGLLAFGNLRVDVIYICYYDRDY